MRVRLTRIDNADLNLFAFDYDLTFMAFFLNADGRVYARYGGRDGQDADNRQSLAGLAYTMQSVLAMHGQAEPAFAPRDDGPKYLRTTMAGKGGGRCMHCHQIKERLDADLKRAGTWTRELAWRYPLPENLGITLEVNRGNVVRQVAAGSAAAAAGLQAGDVLTRLGDVPVHSFGDAQFALDRAPKTGSLAVAWRRGDIAHAGILALADGWRRSDISWRPSVQNLVPSLRLYGTDLDAAERQALGLAPTQLAFRQKDGLPRQPREAGIQPGDIILGLDGRTSEVDVNDLINYVRRHYLVGDTVVVNLLRDGKRLDVRMALLP